LSLQLEPVPVVRVELVPPVRVVDVLVELLPEPVRVELVPPLVRVVLVPLLERLPVLELYELLLLSLLVCLVEFGCLSMDFTPFGHYYLPANWKIYHGIGAEKDEFIAARV
jgi:hypothetical protein